MAVPGGKRRLLGELEFALKLKGAVEAATDLKSVTESVKQLAGGLVATNTAANTSAELIEHLKDRTSELSDIDRGLINSLAKADILYLNMADSIQSLATNKRDLNDLTQRELVQIAKLKIINEGLIKAMKDGPYDEKKLEILKERRDLFEEILSQDRLLTVEQKLLTEEAKKFDQLIRIVGDFTSRMFGSFAAGLKDTTGGVNILKSSLEQMFGFIKKVGTSPPLLKILGLEKTTIEEKGKIAQLLFGKSDTRKIIEQIKTLGANFKGVSSTAKSVSASAGGVSNALGGVASSGSQASAVMGGFRVALGATGAYLPLVIIPIIALAGALVSLIAAFKFLVAGFQDNIKQMERFRLVNFRALGSIHDLISASYDVSAATGLTAEEAGNAVSALSEAGITAKQLATQYGSVSEALRQLARMEGIFVKATGASDQTVAQFLKRLQVANLELNDMEVMLGKVIIKMKNYGIVGREADQIIGTISAGLMEMEGIFSTTDIDSYVNAMSGLAAAAKRAGVEMSVVKQIDSDLRGLKGAATSLVALGGHFEELIAQGPMALENINFLADGYEVLKSQIEDLPVGMRAAAYEAAGINSQMRTLLEAEIRDRQRLASMTAAERAAELSRRQAEVSADNARQELVASYQSSMQTITQQLQMLFAPLLAMAAKIMQPVVEGITQAMNASGPLAEIFSDALNVIKLVGSEIWEVFKPLTPYFKLIGGALYVITKAFFALIVPIVKLGALITKVFLSPLYLIAEILDPIIGSFESMIKAINYAFGRDGAMIILEPFLGALNIIPGITDKIKYGFDLVTDAIKVLGDAFTHPIEAIKRVWDSLTGSSMFHIVEGVQEIVPWIEVLTSAFSALLSPLQLIRETWEWIIGHNEDVVLTVQRNTADVKQQMNGMAMPGPSGTTINVEGLAETAKAVPNPEAVTPIYTVQFDNESLRSQEEHLNDMKALQVEMVSILAKILEKTDPNSARTADAMERIAMKSLESPEVDSFRSRAGFGENVVHWWGK